MFKEALERMCSERENKIQVRLFSLFALCVSEEKMSDNSILSIKCEGINSDLKLCLGALQSIYIHSKTVTVENQQWLNILYFILIIAMISHCLYGLLTVVSPFTCCLCAAIQSML